MTHWSCTTPSRGHSKRKQTDATEGGSGLRTDQFGLAFLEQPLSQDDVADHAALSKLVATPICLDESLNSVERARQAAEQGKSVPCGAMPSAPL